MPGRACCVSGCFNNSVKIQSWNRTVCELHKPLAHVDCPCLRPYGLHRVPGRAVEQNVRLKWIKNINRDGFEPNKYTVVCGIHFPDGQPTREHPYPVLHMGYDCCETHARPSKKRRIQAAPQNSATEPGEENPAEGVKTNSSGSDSETRVKQEPSEHSLKQEEEEEEVSLKQEEELSLKQEEEEEEVSLKQEEEEEEVSLKQEEELSLKQEEEVSLKQEEEEEEVSLKQEEELSLKQEEEEEEVSLKQEEEVSLKQEEEEEEVSLKQEEEESLKQEAKEEEQLPEFTAVCVKSEEEQRDDDEDDDEDWGHPGSSSTAQMQTEAEGDLYNQVHTQGLSGTGPRDLLSGTGPRDLLSGTGPRDLLSGTGPRDLLSGTGPRDRGAERKFECSVCLKRFSYEYRFKAHMRIHTGERPYSCSACKRRFALKEDLNRHQKVHTRDAHDIYSKIKL